MNLHSHLKRISLICLATLLVWPAALGVELTSTHLAPVLFSLPNNPPVLRRNVHLNAQFNQTFPITSNSLYADDVETVDPVEIVYTISPDSTNQFDSTGRILLRGIAVTNRGTFTQEDLNEGRISYRAPASIEFPADRIPFTVQDADGNLARDGQFTVFTFVVDFPNSRPVAVNGQATAPLGGSASGFLPFQDNDTWQGHIFRIVQQPALGTVTITDATTGAFRYQVNAAGQPGTDLFTFHVSDGEEESATPGEFRITITNQPPVAQDLQISLVEDDDAVSHVLPATDPDLPPQTLTFTLVNQPAKGQLQFNAATGSFNYTPNPGRFGDDQFSYYVTDGQFNSRTGIVSIVIRGIPEHEHLFVTGKKEGTQNIGVIYLIDPVTGDNFEIYEGDFLNDSAALVYDPVRGALFVGVNSDTQPYIARIDVATGEPSPAAMGGLLKMPLGLSLDAQGDLIVANAVGGNVVRIDPDTGTQTEIAKGNLLVAPAGVTLAPNGDLIVFDVVNLFEDDGKIIRIDPGTGTQTLLSSAPELLDPIDGLRLPNGNFLVCGRGGILELNAANTLRSVVPQSAFQSFPKEMILDADGTLYVVDFGAGILRVDAATGAFSSLPTPGLVEPVAIAAFSQAATLEGWRATYFSAADLGDPGKEAAVWGDLADPDGDAIANLYEYALDLNPTVANDPSRTFMYGVIAEGTERYFAIQFKARKSDPALRITLEVTLDFATWASAGQFQLVDTDSAGALFDTLTYRTTRPLTAGEARFFRLKVERNTL